MNTINPKDKIKQIFETTIDSGLKYTGNIKELDFYSLICLSTTNSKSYKILNCNLMMFNYEFENQESILMVFSIPILSSDGKHVSERITDVLKLVEECFVTIDYMDLKNSKEDKCYYMSIVKSLKDEE